MNFTTSIPTNIAAEEAIKKIGNVTGWWEVTATGSADKQGDTFAVKMSGDSYFNIKVDEIGARRVVWLVTGCHMPWYKDKTEWTGTKMIFELNGDTLTFTHEGITPEVECYNDCKKGWTQFIGTNLKNQITRARVTIGNHASVIVPKQDRDAINKFYCEVLGGKITKAEEERDFIKIEDAYLVFLYGDVPDAGEFQRTARAMWLEFKSDNVDVMRKRIEDAQVTILHVPDPHLYFQAPGGQCWRLVGLEEDLSQYEGAKPGTSVTKLKESLKN